MKHTTGILIEWEVKADLPKYKKNVLSRKLHNHKAQRTGRPDVIYNRIGYLDLIPSIKVGRNAAYIVSRENYYGLRKILKDEYLSKFVRRIVVLTAKDRKVLYKNGT